MSRHHKPRAFWRLARIWFRHVRITVWLLILLLLLSILYLHNFGLPGFARNAVIHAFADKGITLDFTKLRLAWSRGIIAEGVRLETAGTGWVPRIASREVQFDFDPLALLKLKIIPKSLGISDGLLLLPYPQTNGVPGELTATNLQALIRFQSGSTFSLEKLSGEIAGCYFTASGTLANPQQLQDWRVLQSRAAESRGQAYEVWRAISEVRKDIEFLTPPELSLVFNVDGAAPEKLSIGFTVRAEAAASPLGLLERPEVSARLDPMEDGACSQVELMVQVGRIASDFGSGEDLVFYSSFSCLAETGSLLAGQATLSAQELNTPWIGAVDLQSALGWSCDGTNVIPTVAELEVQAAELSAQFGWAEGFQTRIRLSPFTGDHRSIHNLPEFIFRDLEPYSLQASVKSETIHTASLSATNLALTAGWSSPQVIITNLNVDWAGGHLDAGADFDAISGRLQFQASSDFDLKRFYPLLPKSAVDWLDFFTWEKPPRVNGVGAITLPPRPRFSLTWPGDLLPSLYLHGDFNVGDGTYRRIPLTGASSHFTYSNMCWYLPDLTLQWPEGSLRVEHHNNDRTRAFIWKVDGAMDPTPALILLSEDAAETREVLGTLRFGGPPEVHLQFQGNWNTLQEARGWGTVSATNIAFRGQSFDALECNIGFTNLALTISRPHVRSAEGTASADSLQFDFQANLAFLSNGVSTMPPMTVATVIGPDVIHAIEHYHFLNPPSGLVEGVIPLKGVAGADLRFNLKGGPFEWWNFHLTEIEGAVHWKEETVSLEIPHAGFYEGTASGEGFFDFTGKKDADFHFNFAVENANVQPLVEGAFQSTNRMEGRLTGSLSITNANTGDFGSWFGYGYATLQDGFLWNVPVFGIVSPLLDIFVPGLGSSLAKEADGRYSVTNSVIRTEDLVIRTSNMRLLYAGTVDFEGRVDAVAEAEILRDTFILGGLVSTALTPLSKALIVEITGTLADPQARPLYLVPRILLAPLNPVKLLKNVFAPPKPKYSEPPTPSGSPGTMNESGNSDPAKKPE